MSAQDEQPTAIGSLPKSALLQRYGDVSWERMIRAVEKVRPNALAPSPDVAESEQTGSFRLVTLDALVRMKLTAYQDKDRTHLRDLIEVGLVDATWCTRMPSELAGRLQSLLDTPEG